MQLKNYSIQNTQLQGVSKNVTNFILNNFIKLERISTIFCT